MSPSRRAWVEGLLRELIRLAREGDRAAAEALIEVVAVLDGARS